MVRAIAASLALLVGGCASIAENIAIGLADQEAALLLTPTGPVTASWSETGVDPVKLAATFGTPAVLFEADRSAPTIYAYDVVGADLVPPGWEVVERVALGSRSAEQGRREVMLARLSPLSMVMMESASDPVGSARCMATRAALSVTYLRPTALRDVPPSTEEAAFNIATRRYFDRLAATQPCAVLRRNGDQASYRFHHFTRDGRPLGRMLQTLRPVTVVSVADVPQLLRLR